MHLESIQSKLVDVGSCIATPLRSASEDKKYRVQFDEQSASDLELWIDELDSQLPPLKNFILPSGGQVSAHLHAARAICRRLERSIWESVHDEDLEESVAIFLNRLSDFLFVCARYAAMQDGKPETIYKKGVGLKINL
eukprot:TRINITY_DN1864_c0_g1_i4.p1 TRINITY_DN1864_c0_g1~~TRINITY_DN1864_c0_g1_i4.p1  ORF type:complete len:138 (+),score=25.15 TRINITY_DN1864_c0_g1_i4:274-687(+)